MRNGGVGARIALGAALVALAGGIASGAPDALEKKRREYEARRQGLRFEAAKEHIELGIWCRDAGLVPQATAEFLRAQEVGEGKVPIADKLVNIMRAYGDDFWTNVQKKPRAYLDTYEKKAKGIETKRQKSRMSFAKELLKKDMPSEAHEEYATAVRFADGPLVFDAEGQVVLEAGKVPSEVSKRMKDEAIQVNDLLYLRDEFLSLVPKVKVVREADSPRVRVRTQGPEDHAKNVLTAATQVFPRLEEDMGGRPTRKMQVFVFTEKEAYVDYLKAAGMESFSSATGFADGKTFTAVVSAAGLPIGQSLGMALHEMAHLFHYGVTPTVMPSWYAEGFAETYGGDGTFTFDGTTLSPAAALPKHRFQAFQGAARIPLSELVSSDALTLLSKDRANGLRFYAQSWAFLTWIRTASPKEVAAKFKRWEVECRGTAIGAQAGKARQTDFRPAVASFQRAFGADLATMETDFRAWTASR